MNKKNKKRSLVLSLLCMLLCTAMLVGSTFAWFTDTASTKVNKIQAGTLDITLEMSNDNGKTWVNAEGEKLNFIDDATGTIKENILWEPGARFKLQPIRLVNNGNLAAKCKIHLVADTIEGAKYNLADVIDVSVEKNGVKKDVGTLSNVIAAGYTMDAEFNLPAKATEDYGTIVLTMKTTADNNYQKLTLENLAIEVLAAQAVEEHDSFNNTYDASSKFPDGKTGDVIVKPGTAEDLHAILTTALTGGSTDGTITIDIPKDFDLTGWETIAGSNYSGVNNVVIDGHGYTFTNLTAPLLDTLFAGSDGSFEVKNLNIKDSTISVAGGKDRGVGVILNTADANNAVAFTDCTLDNVTITNTGTDSYLGGFIGYSSSKNLTFTNCSVINSNFTGMKDIGAFVGYTTATMNVTDATVTGNTITSSNNSTYRVGAIAGTVNSSPATITTKDVSNNTITQTSASTKKQNDYVGRNLATVTVNGTPYTYQ